jgi:hypothetical protein
MLSCGNPIDAGLAALMPGAAAFHPRAPKRKKTGSLRFVAAEDSSVSPRLIDGPHVR